MRIVDCVKWLWKASQGFRLRILGYGITGVIHVAVSLLFVWVCKHLIDIVTGYSADDLITYIVCMVGCMVVQLLLSAASSRMSNHIEIQMRNRMRNRLFAHLMETRWMGRESMHTGDVLNRVMGDVATVTDALCRNIPSVLVTLIQLAGALFFLSRLDARLAWILFFIMPVALLFSKGYVRTMRRLTRSIRDTDSRIQSHFQENLQHRVLIRSLEYTSHVIEALTSLQTDLQQKVMKRTNFSVFSRLMVQVGFAVGYIVAFLWGILGIRDGAVTFGMMTAFLQLVSQVQRPMVDLSRQIPAFVQVFTSGERLAELFGFPLEQKGEVVRLQGRLGIRLENLTFAYPATERNVLDGLTHDFTPGSMTVILGETGAGKSTLVRLILALLQPDKGKIVLYNERREEKVVSSLTRCNISYVPQGNTLISGTIRDNLLMGKPDATDEELRKALYVAAADFVFSLPLGLDTLCGELGTGISEGQAQRIAIARGLLRPGGILLLDEPTSSLDNETENILLERISQNVKDKTLIVVTHREAITRMCSSTLRIVRQG